MCARLAISGTTPRYLAWSSTWVATTLERTSYAVRDDGGGGFVAGGFDAEDRGHADGCG